MSRRAPTKSLERTRAGHVSCQCGRAGPPASLVRRHKMKTYFLTGLAAAFFVSGCGKAPPTQTSTNPELPLTGAEVWKVDGTNFNVEGTAALVMGNGQTLVVVKALCDFRADGSHRPIAEALAKYAVDHGYQNALTASSSGGAPRPFSGSSRHHTL